MCLKFILHAVLHFIVHLDVRNTYSPVPRSTVLTGAALLNNLTAKMHST